MAFSAIEDKKAELIRKALTGGAFYAESSVAAITSMTTSTGSPAVIDLDPSKFTGYEDLGFFTDDGISHSTETTQSDITSWQSVSPTRSDITTETTQVTVVMQETKASSLALYTGVAKSTIGADATTGEVFLAKPTRPTSRSYRLLTLAVDESSDGEIYIAHFFPNAKVVGKAEQVYGKGDVAIGWGVTFQGFIDSDLGYSESLLFGGPGWEALVADMGFPVAS